MKHFTLILFLLTVIHYDYILSQPKTRIKYPDTESRYKRADSLYEQKNYRSALKEYLTVAYSDSSTYKSPLLNGDLINCYLDYILEDDKSIYPEIPDSLLEGIAWFPIDKEPEVTLKVDPVYPKGISKHGNVTIILKVWIDTLGNARAVKISKSSDRLFNETAIDAAYKWKFRPAIYKNKKIGCWIAIPMRFKAIK